MFCSKCGKTIRPDDQLCPSCQSPIGDNRFGGMPYTSAQFTIAPGQTSFEPLNDYTRTTYTSMDEAASAGGEVDSRTTYRPVYEGASAPEDVRRNMRAAVARDEEEPQPSAQAREPLSTAAQETLEALDEDLQPDEEIDLDQFRSRPIQSAGRAGISRDVSDYIRQLEGDQGRRGRRSSRTIVPIYDEEHGYAVEDDGGDAPAEAPDYDEIDDGDYEDMRPAPRFGVRQIVKILIALVVLAGVVYGGISWIKYVRGNQSSAPIEGVSETLYTNGVAMIKSHVDSTYVNQLIATYTSDGAISMSNQLLQDSAAIDALLPETPAANDQTFIDALQAIQNNITNSVTMDAISVGSGSVTAVQESEGRWQIVNSSIAQLEAAASAAELTAIINGQTITVQSATPAPTATPVAYTALQKGDKSDEVLKLQNRLYELGYLNDDRDGAFGSKTQTAVKLFQQTAGLTASGIADSETQTRLYGADAPYASGAATPAPTAPVETIAPTDAAIQPVQTDQPAA